MKIEIIRFVDSGKATRGLLFIDGEYQCFTLEDTYHETKVQDETRIPAGTYKMDFRRVSPLSSKYKKRYPDMHKGMLWLLEVPGFEWIYIHVGNNDKHTRGCILVGEGSRVDVVSSSRKAYKNIYPRIAAAIESGEGVTCSVIDKIRGV